jgi:hypothetical protein
LSARFSFNDLLGFFTFCILGDLSPIARSFPAVGRGVWARVGSCGAQRSHHPFVVLDAERRGVTTSMALPHMTPTETRT